MSNLSRRSTSWREVGLCEQRTLSAGSAELRRLSIRLGQCAPPPTIRQDRLAHPGRFGPRPHGGTFLEIIEDRTGQRATRITSQVLINRIELIVLCTVMLKQDLSAWQHKRTGSGRG